MEHLAFEGSWEGEGAIAGRGPLRWLMPNEPFRIRTRIDRLSATIWVVRDEMEFTRGGELRRTMFLEHLGEGRYHATADDMPLGADVEVGPDGYRYSPYHSWSKIRGRRWWVRVRERGSFDADGSIRAHFRMAWKGIPIATNELVLRPVSP